MSNERTLLTERVGDWIENDEHLHHLCQGFTSSKQLKDHITEICTITHPYDQSKIYVTPNGDDLSEVYWDMLLENIQPEPEKCGQCDEVKEECGCDKCDQCDDTKEECLCKCETCKEFLSHCGCEKKEDKEEEDDRETPDFQKLHRGY